jgi:MarR family transcriptional regulator, organic hydroperoxide resistance regulator
MNQSALESFVARSGKGSASDGPLVDEIIAVLGEAFSEMKCIGSERMMRSGLSMSHWHLLVLLARHGEMSMSRIAEVHGISLSNATGLVDRLVERHLVDRSRLDDDRRVVVVRVSDAGREMLAQADLLREELVRRVMSQLDDAQLERLADALGDVRTALGRALADDSDPSLREHLASHSHAVAHGRAHPESAAV